MCEFALARGGDNFCRSFHNDGGICPYDCTRKLKRKLGELERFIAVRREEGSEVDFGVLREFGSSRRLPKLEDNSPVAQRATAPRNYGTFSLGGEPASWRPCLSMSSSDRGQRHAGNPPAREQSGSTARINPQLHHSAASVYTSIWQRRRRGAQLHLAPSSVSESLSTLTAGLTLTSARDEQQERPPSRTDDKEQEPIEQQERPPSRAIDDDDEEEEEEDAGAAYTLSQSLLY
jgi:hypothetical protein